MKGTSSNSRTCSTIAPGARDSSSAETNFAGARVKRGSVGPRVQDAIRRSVLVSDLLERCGHVDDDRSRTASRFAWSGDSSRSAPAPAAMVCPTARMASASCQRFLPDLVSDLVRRRPGNVVSIEDHHLGSPVVSVRTDSTSGARIFESPRTPHDRRSGLGRGHQKRTAPGPHDLSATRGRRTRPKSRGRFAPEAAVSSTTSALLLFCLQARESWLTLTEELTCPSAAPGCSSPGQRGSRCRVGRRSSSRSVARVTPRRMDAFAMRGDAAASDRATRSAPARPERARGGPGSGRAFGRIRSRAVPQIGPGPGRALWRSDRPT